MLRAFVDKTFPATEVAEATRHLESRKGAGTSASRYAASLVKVLGE